MRRGYSYQYASDAEVACAGGCRATEQCVSTFPQAVDAKVPMMCNGAHTAAFAGPFFPALRK